MKAKKIVPENSEQPKPPLAPLNQQSEQTLAPWQTEIAVLGEARVRMDGEAETVDRMLNRALGLCRHVEDMCLGCEPNEVSLKALMHVMLAAQESIHIALWITRGKDANFGL